MVSRDAPVSMLPRTAAKPLTVAILAEHVLDEYQNTVLFGANDELRERGATVLFFCGGVLESKDPNSAQRNPLYGLIDQRRVDAVIVLTPIANQIGPSRLSEYCSRFDPLPVCALSVDLPGRPSVLVDNDRGMREVLEHMIAVHHRRRIAFVRGPAGNEEAERRFRIYREVLDRNGIAFDPQIVSIGDFTQPSGVAAAHALCPAPAPDRELRFDALVAANDYMALGAIEVLQSLGIDIPHRVAVAGFDDIDEARFATPPLTTVRQPLYDSGRQAGRILAAMLRGEKVERRTVLDTTLVLRESCGCSVDQAVSTTASGEFASVRSLAEYVVSKRADIVRALSQSVSAEHARIGSEWAEPLFDAFVADLDGRGGDRFVAALEGTLRRVVAAGGSIRPWHAAISVLWNASICAVGDPSGTYLADETLQRARVLIGDLRERVQAQHRIRRERWIRTLHETSEALMTAFGSEALVQAIAEQLPHLQIPACALAVYGRDDTRGQGLARPLFLYEEGRVMPLSDEPFEAWTLAPGGWIDAKPRTLVVEPLVFHGEHMGFALLAVGPREGTVYEGLRELVSSAMKGTRLVEQVVLEATRRQAAEKERLEKEMEIAARIQTTIVPKKIQVPGLDISALMVPATEVGGDYYDVMPFEGGCWIGIGDVAGHGLQTGLVMLMIQSVVAALVQRNPQASPCAVLKVLNAVMYDNVHRRMNQDEHATLSLLRYDGAGSFSFAGAHEDIIVYRTKRGEVECFETRGPWVGAFPDIDRMLVETSLTLDTYDLMVLYTDGMTEAKDTRGVQFGLERLCAIVSRLADQPVTSIRDQLVAAVRAWTKTQEDDMSVVVVRRLE
jgi:DNA-binding LacI/PurR family transcriptional regulator/serine phosphatase RsbU (regulator of sigma subunit)